MSSNTYHIPEGRELRIECYKNEKIMITVTPSTVEVNGLELLQTHTFINRNFAVFAWFDTDVTIEGKCKQVYVSEDSMTPIYLDIHRQLQIARDQVRQSNTRTAPRVLILSNANHGKFTLAETLLSYATRNGETPVYLDLDIASGNITVPGCLSACVLTQDNHLATYAQKSVLSPIVQFFGYQHCMDNPELFKSCLSTIANHVNTRMTNDAEAAHGGLIVNGGSWYKEEGSKPLLEDVVNLLKIDVILVIHDDQIYNEMKNRFPDCCVKMIPLSKGTLITANIDRENSLAIDYYFYGSSETEAQLAVPNELIRTMNELTIVAYPNSDEMMHRDTFAAQETEEENVMLKVSPVSLSDLRNQILAVTDAKTIDDIKDCSILGFVFVTMVDEVNNKVHLVTPCGGDLPGTIMLKGNISWNQ